ncbi:TPA: hypothetical protein ACY4PQ_004963 [Vibrio parahaemolyticus]
MNYTVVIGVMRFVVGCVMERVQCTFRLPKHVIELIEKQEGKTKTDKLLKLIGAVESNVMQSVVSDALQDRLLMIEKRLTELEVERKKVNKPVATTLNGANQKRKEETIRFIENELMTLTVEQVDHASKARYPLSEVRKMTSITKSQSDTYADMIREFLNGKSEDLSK